MKLNFKGMMLLSKVVDEIGFKSYQEDLLKKITHKLYLLNQNSKKLTKKEISKEIGAVVLADVISFFLANAHRCDSLEDLLCSFGSVKREDFEDFEMDEIMNLILGLIKYVISKSAILEKLGVKINLKEILQGKKENVQDEEEV